MLGYQSFVPPLQVVRVLQDQGRKGVNVPVYGSGPSTTLRDCDSVEVKVGILHGLVLVIGRLFLKVRMKGRTTVISRGMNRVIEHMVLLHLLTVLQRFWVFLIPRWDPIYGGRKEEWFDIVSGWSETAIVVYNENGYPPCS